jgi:hypothetical protein
VQLPPVMPPHRTRTSASCVWLVRDEGDEQRCHERVLALHEQSGVVRRDSLRVYIRHNRSEAELGQG